MMVDVHLFDKEQLDQLQELVLLAKVFSTHEFIQGFSRIGL